LTINSFRSKNIATRKSMFKKLACRLLPVGQNHPSIPPLDAGSASRRLSVRRRLTSWARPLAGIVALVVAVTFAAPPASAADAKVSTPRADTSRLAATTAARLAALAPTPRAFAQTQSAPAASGTDSKSFFSTPTGVAAIVLMAAGAGFAIWSANHDRKPVKSPIR
jgi:type VI protein secretion system component VasF